MATTTRWTELSRKYGWDRNPLRRRSDLVAAWLLPAAIAVFLILGTVAVLLIGSVLRADNAVAWHQARQHWQAVPGRLTAAAPGPAQADNGANTWTVPAPARWVDSPVTVWLDHKGRVQTPPMTATQLGSRVLETRVVVLALLALLLTFGTGAACSALERRRVTNWETEWLQVEPRWSRQS
jgi:hypothetical protein